MSRGMSRAARMAIVVTLVGVVGTPSVVRAAAVCNYLATTHTVTVDGDGTMELVRVGDEIHLSGVGVCSNGAVDATVTNTDQIDVGFTGPGLFIFNQEDGRFAPGFTNEPGSSDEIEVSMNGGGVALFGTPGDDHIVLGIGGVNLNAREAADDVDVNGMAGIAFIAAAGGNDTVTTRGGHGTGPAIDPEIAILGEGGNDKLLSTHRVQPGDGIIVGPGPQYDLDGGAGNDRLEGGALVDELTGGDGNDYIDGGAGLDDLDGEDGENTVGFLLANQSVTVRLDSNVATQGEDTESIPAFNHVVGSNKDDDIDGDAGVNRIEGRGGADVIDGLAGVDQIFGQAGDDRVTGRAQNESLNGGKGSDRVGYSGIIIDEVDLMIGASTGPSGGDTLVSIENAGAPAPVRLIGNARPNTLGVFGSGVGEIIGNGGNDDIDGGEGFDQVNGGGGNDTITGEGGGDELRGGAGNDTYHSSPGNEKFLGGTGRDLVDFFGFTPVTVDLRITTPQVTGHGSDGFVGIEDVVGSLRSDVIIGSAAGNRLEGGRGNDQVRGEGGNDTITGNVGDDELVGGAGRDTVAYTDATSGVVVDLAKVLQDTNWGWDTLELFENVIGSGNADLLSGNGAANVLFGGGGSDKLNGSAGADRLLGQGGNDDLTGGPGSDVCFGGPGTDTLHSCE